MNPKRLNVQVRYFLRFAYVLPGFALFACIGLSLLKDFDKTTKTHCNVYNFLPSISASIGDCSPQRYIWRFCFALDSVPRYIIGFLQMNKLLSRRVQFQEIYELTQYFNGFMHFLELTFLLLLTYVSSNEIKWIHENSFIAFMTMANEAIVGILDYICSNDINDCTDRNNVSTKYVKPTKAERRSRMKQRRLQRSELKPVGFRKSSENIDNKNNNLNSTSIYFFENGLRKVFPYYFTWSTYAKQRWYGRTIEDIFTHEFRRSINKQNFEDLIHNGLIRINNKNVDKNYIMKNGDRLEHLTHRHEVPVIHQDISILCDNKDYLVIDKPCSIPVHPCGKYRYNTILAILAYDYNYNNLRTIHRLDRMTSGILIMTKSAQKARAVDFNDRSSSSIEKLYLCRVRGIFPYEKIICVNKPLETISFQLGLCKIGGDKECKTLFQRITYDELLIMKDKFIFDNSSDQVELIDQTINKYLDQSSTATSLVLCRPLSGRMHQIRVHLQYLGFPIVNDPLYNAPDIWGPSNGQYANYEHSNEHVIGLFINRHSCENWLMNEIEDNEMMLSNQNEEMNKNEKTNNKRVQCEDENNKNVKKPKYKSEIDVNDENSIKNYITQHCYECQNNFREPTPSDLLMYLHSIQYKLNEENTFTSNIPEWAKITSST
ncbi:unnamed protein product [Didymodactylos carnosus]|uniref:Pseudouridine synthase RsuA/RluA-like domain-containing protein n=2 Tax=Didymodactylos carnosus TaxID=1234261 RepID=A0A813WZY1_9BILA|nr:unnamed protein product [Didymodactylos carnosus]CAF3650676.1 unnamed protein product [Didymodactylos carnosus]